MSATLRMAKWSENRAPGLTRAIAAPKVVGAEASSDTDTTVWRPTGRRARALVVCFLGHPTTSRWLAGSIAARLGAVVVVPDEPISGQRPHESITELSAIRETEKLNDVPVAVVGEGRGTSDALAASLMPGVARLALISPTGIPPELPGRLPTVLIQASADSSTRADVVLFDAALRLAGVAVRETEYSDIGEEWASYPRLVRGSGRALDDLVGFLDRGLGEASTFEVIPGWDLH